MVNFGGARSVAPPSSLKMRNCQKKLERIYLYTIVYTQIGDRGGSFKNISDGRTDGHTDPKIGPQVYLGPMKIIKSIKRYNLVQEVAMVQKIQILSNLTNCSLQILCRNSASALLMAHIGMLVVSFGRNNMVFVLKQRLSWVWQVFLKIIFIKSFFSRESK